MTRLLGYSKSQLYRKMILLFGKSPNTFIKEYRLNKALKLLNRRTDNISEISYETGFNSPSYFLNVSGKDVLAILWSLKDMIISK